ncbi:juvenile hormone acid O-methyltransferase-like [Rhipicephalus microplus]|uniref:juvenile hormone acid O-methyltransferase-like n=1 Tax=Rhipicephalus microplus TaxID=6941 RepID=UPI003F6CA9A1
MGMYRESNARLLDTFKNAFASTLTSKTNASDDNLPAPRFIDIGCGTGNFTLNYLLPRCSCQCLELVGVDNSPAMLEYARIHHSHEKIRYEHLDIVEGDVDRFVTEHGLFARLFSFNSMHWIKDKARAFRNMEKLMAPGAECFIVFEYSIPIFEVFMALAGSLR